MALSNMIIPLVIYSCLLVSNVANGAPVIVETSMTLYIPEDANTSLPINPNDPIIAYDNDSDTVNYYILQQGPYLFFRVETLNDTEGYLYFLNNVSLDRETRNAYTVVVYVTNDDNDTLPHDNITINVILLDVNDNSPIFLYNYAVYLPENSTSVNYVLPLVAADFDVGTNAKIHFSLVSVVPNTTVTIGDSSITVDLQPPLDYEKIQQFNVTIAATDSGDPPRATIASFFIFITDIDDNPPAFTEAIYNASIPEDTNTGTNILNVTAYDLDRMVDDKIIYSLLSVPNINGVPYYIINSTTGHIQLNLFLDYEDVYAHQFIAVATEDSIMRRNTTATINISVINVNDNSPVFSSLSYEISVPENTLVGSILLNITAIDVDFGDSITYSLLGYSDVIEINNTTGEVTLVGPLDREVVSSYELLIAASDNGDPSLTANTMVTVTVLDINDNPPIFASATYNASVVENSIIGTLVIVVHATDGDGTSPNNLITYSLLNNNDTFNINSTTGEVTLVVSLDREFVSSYELLIAASDNGDPSLTANTMVTVTVLDVNDNSPIFASATYNASVVENSIIGTLVITVNAIDADGASPNNLITYSLMNNNDTFNINSTTGEVTLVVVSLDREVISSYELLISASDNGDPSRTANTMVTVTVLDINDNPPRFASFTYNALVVENSIIGTLVIVVHATDDDGTSPNNLITYSLLNNNDTFNINSTTGVVYTISQLDYEKQASYNLIVVASDNGIPTLAIYTTVTVTVLDINDNPPIFASVTYNASVVENSIIGTLVIVVHATDGDGTSPNNLITYSLLNNNDTFNINSTTGVVYTISQLDYEKQASYNLIVVASDNGIPTLASYTTVIINVIDINDNYPVWSPQPLIHITETAHHYVVNMLDSADVGTTVITLHAADADSGIFGSVSYAIFISEASLGIFAISVVSDATIITTSMLESDVVHTLTVVASDGEGLSTTASVTVIVLDSNDMSPQFSPNSYYVGDDYYSVFISEGASINTPVLQLSVNKTSEAFLHYFLHPLDLFPFTINAFNGTISVNGILDRETVPNYVITAYVTDSFYNDSAFINITIIDVNDNAPVFSNSLYFAYITENSNSGPVIVYTVEGSVVSIEATDIDKGGTPFATIIYNTTGPYSDYINIDPFNATISISNSTQFDYETIKTLNITLTATDLGGLYTSAVLVLSILDEYEEPVNSYPPQFTSPSYTYIMSEHNYNTPFTSVVIDMGIMAHDDDVGDRVEYMIGSVVPSSMRYLFHINSTNANIIITGRLDRESTPVIILTIIAMDSFCPYYSSTALLHVILLDVNEYRPFDYNYTSVISIYENAPIGSIVYAFNATDKDATDDYKPIVFVMQLNNSELFSLNPISGVVRTAGVLDRESNLVYVIIGACNDGVIPADLCGILTHHYSISVLDVNDNSPQFDYNTYTTGLCYDTPLNTTVLQVTASDSDFGINARVSYYTVLNPTHFTINTTTGKLILTGYIDPLYIGTNISFQVRAIDGGLPQLSSTCDVIIHIIDCSHNSSLYFKESFKEEYIMEGLSIGSMVTSVETNKPVNFSIVISNSQSLPFSILTPNDTKGVIHTNQAVSVGNKNTYTLLIKAIDSAVPPNTAYTVVKVNVFGFSFEESFYYFTVDENEANVLVGSVKAILTGQPPPDINPNITYLPVAWSDQFMLDANNGSITVLIPIDKEDIDNYNMEITALYDNNVNVTTRNAYVSVMAINVNDNNPFFVQSLYSTSVPENAPPGFVLGKVSATDRDLEDNPSFTRAITYSILSGNNDGLFGIDSNFGILFTVGLLDYEVTSSYNLTIEAQDNGVPLLTGTTHFFISVTNQVECLSKTHLCTNTSVRLSPLTADTSLIEGYRHLMVTGALEVCVNNEYRKVCHDSLSISSYELVTLACRQLGYNGVSTYYTGNGTNLNQIHIDSITCSSGANNLSQCSITTDNTMCANILYANCTRGLVCEGPSLSLRYSMTEVRDGYTYTTGLVDVCTNGVMSSLCNDGTISNSTSYFICQTLGYDFGTVQNISSFVYGNLPQETIYYTNVTCYPMDQNWPNCFATTDCYPGGTYVLKCGAKLNSNNLTLLNNKTNVVGEDSYTYGIAVHEINEGAYTTLCNDGTITDTILNLYCIFLGFESGLLLNTSSLTIATLPLETVYYSGMACPPDVTNLSNCRGFTTQCYKGGAFILECYKRVESKKCEVSPTSSAVTTYSSNSAIVTSSVLTSAPSPSSVPMPCETETDAVHSLTWSKLLVGESLTQSCPPGRSGNITRYCTSQGWSVINATVCPKILLLQTNATLSNIAGGMTNYTSQEENDEVNKAINEVNNDTTADNTTLISSDVLLINNIVETSISILSNNIGQSNITNPFLETGILQVFNTLLDDEIVQQLKVIQTEESGSEKLLANIEGYGDYAGEFLKVYNDTGITVNGTFTSEKENLVFQVKVLETDGLKDVIFPLHSELQIYTVNNSFSQVRIPYQHLEDRQGEGLIAVVNTLIKNLGNFLPDSLSNVTMTGSQIISTQVIADVNTSDIPAIFTFTTFPFKNVTNPRCVFWDYSSSRYGSNGHWSSEGIETVSSDYQLTGDGYVQIVHVANTSHITPFVVLVDVHGVELSDDEYVALEVVTYGGLAVSSICCVLTIIVLATLKKDLIINVLYLIHFNLSISLLLGYLVFIFGIDEKVINFTNTKIGCGFIAGVLHYFFMASFCWMLCEGLMLFLQVVIVFNSFTKRWYLFLLIGWGLPIIPVAISAGLIYDEYGVLGKHCWLNFANRAAIWAFLGPALLIVLINTGLLMLIILALARYHKRRQQDQGQKKLENLQKFQIFRQTLVGALTLVPLLGVTWPVSLLCFNNETSVFGWIFTVLATMQGCFIFLFNVIRNEKIRTIFLKTCCSKLEKSKQQKAINAQNINKIKKESNQLSSYGDYDHYYNSSISPMFKRRKREAERRIEGNTRNERKESGSYTGSKLSDSSLIRTPPPVIQIDDSPSFGVQNNYQSRSTIQSTSSYLQVPKRYR